MKKIFLIRKVMKVGNQLLKVARILLASGGHRKVLLIVESDSIQKTREDDKDVIKVYIEHPEVFMFIYKNGLVDAINIPSKMRYNELVQTNQNKLNS